MQIKTGVTGVTAITDVQIQQEAQKILIEIGGVFTASQLAAVQVDWSYQGSASIDRMAPAISLLHLAEIACFDEGYFVNKTNDFKGQIVIGKDGAVPLQSNAYISLNIKGLISTMVVNIYTINSPMADNAYLKYEELVVIDGSTKQWNVEKAHQIAIPVARVAEIQLTYPSRTLKYTRAELESIARDVNDLVCEETGGFVYGFKNYLVLDIADAITLDVTPTDETKTLLYCLRERVLAVTPPPTAMPK